MLAPAKHFRARENVPWGHISSRKKMFFTVESRPLAGEINIFEGEEKVTNLFFSGFGVLTSVVIVIMQMTLK